MKKIITILTTLVMTSVYATLCVQAADDVCDQTTDNCVCDQVTHIYVCGDVDMDGKVDVSDAVKIKRYIIGTIPFLPWNKGMTEPVEWTYDYVCGDVNQDGEVTIADAVVTVKYIAKIIEELPVTPETVENDTNCETENFFITEEIFTEE